MGGWGGPEKDRVLRHCLVHGLAIICHLVQVLLQGTFPGSGSGLIGCGTVFMVSDPIVVWGAVPSWCFVSLLSLLLALQVCAHGKSGSCVLSKESWLGSMGCELLTSGGSVVRFSSICWLFLAGPSCFSAAFFAWHTVCHLHCALFLDIACWTALNDRPHFLATSLMFLALLTM